MTTPRPPAASRYRPGLAALLLSVFFNYHRFLDVPPGPRFDEVQDMLLVKQVLAGAHPLYFSGNYGEEPVTIYLQAASVSWLGWNDLAMRLPASFLGLVTVALIYRLGWSLFSPAAGFSSAALAAVNLWLVLFSRLGLNAISLPPMVALSMYCLWRGLTNRRRVKSAGAAWLALAGLALGGAAYTYTAGRTYPLFILFMTAYLFAFYRKRARVPWIGWLAFVTAATLAGLLLVWYLRANPGAETRLEALQGALHAARRGDLREVLWLSWRAAAMFGIRGGDEWLYNVPGRPTFDPLTTLAFTLGVLVALLQLRRLSRGLVLAAFFAGLAPAMLAGPPGSPNHALFALPGAFLLAGFGASLGEAALRRIGLRRWTTPALAGLVLLNAGLNYRAYFGTWAAASQVRWEHQAGATQAGRYLDAHPPEGPVAMAADNAGYYNPAMRVGYEISTHRPQPVRWYQPEGAFIWPAGGPATYFFPVHDPPGIALAEPLARRYFVGAQTVLEQHFPDGEPAFSAYRLPGTARPEAGALGLEARWPADLAIADPAILPLSFDDGLTLNGFELEPAAAMPGHEVLLFTYWQVQHLVEHPAIQFVHLLDEAGRLRAQSDRQDVWLPSLRADDAYVQLHRLWLPEDAPAGEYWFQTGLYTAEDQVRAQILQDGRPLADRLWLGPLFVLP